MRNYSSLRILQLSTIDDVPLFTAGAPSTSQNLYPAHPLLRLDIRAPSR
jgi:hypothetical protein